MKGRVKWWEREKGYGFIEYAEDINAFVRVKKEQIDVVNFKENDKIDFELDRVGVNLYLKVNSKV